MTVTFDSSAPGPDDASGDEGELQEGVDRPFELTLLPSHRSTVGDETIRLSVRIVDASGIAGQLGVWKEAGRRGPGGRPETFSTRAMLVGLVACALTNQPLHRDRLTEILFSQLSPAWRGQLGLPEPPAPGDRLGWKAIYRNVGTRFHGMLALVDPSATPKNRRLDADTFNRLTAQRRGELSEDEWAERYDRLEWLINALIEAGIAVLLPREVRRAFHGSVGVDGTLVRGHSRPDIRKRGSTPKKGRKPEIELHSVDPDAGFYVRQADERDAGVDATTGRDNIAWGYEATFAVSGPATPDEDGQFPNVILGMTVLDQPGARSGVTALGSWPGWPPVAIPPVSSPPTGRSRAPEQRSSNSRPSPSATGPSTTTRSTSWASKTRPTGSSRSKAPGTARPSLSRYERPAGTTATTSSTKTPTTSASTSARSMRRSRRAGRTPRVTCGCSARPPARGRWPAAP
jgi:hypothetical protein